MSFEAPIIVNTRDPIRILTEQFLEAISESGLIILAGGGLQGSADPFFGRGLVVVVLGFIPPPVRRCLI